MLCEENHLGLVKKVGSLGQEEMHSSWHGVPSCTLASFYLFLEVLNGKNRKHCKGAVRQFCAREVF